MEHILPPLKNINNSNNDFMGAFVNLMRYKGIELDERKIQLLYAGIKLNLTYHDEISLSSNFSQGVHNFCAENSIKFKEMNIPSGHMKEAVYDILATDGPCIICLDSGNFKYYKSFVNDDVRHCVTVTGIDEGGFHIVDSYASPAPGSTYQGVLPFSGISDRKTKRQIRIAYVEGKPEVSFDDSRLNLTLERQKYINENIYMEPGSRLKTSADYCEYIRSDMSVFQGAMLRKVAYNIMTDTHVPQLRMIIPLFIREKEKYTKLCRLSNDWLLLSYRFLKDSFSIPFQGQDILLENYRALVSREQHIYMQ